MHPYIEPLIKVAHDGDWCTELTHLAVHDNDHVYMYINVDSLLGNNSLLLHAPFGI